MHFIIQARLGSTRLPNKILLPFYKSKSILELLIEKLSNIENVNIILATSVDRKNDLLEEIAQKKKILCFRGSESDVLQRFIDAAEKFNAKKLIRICSDNPFLELESIKKLINVANNTDCDYISFNINGKPSIKTHYGFWCEYVTLSALKKVSNLTNDRIYHEHVTNYIYEHPNEFDIKWINSDIIENHHYIRLTIDTQEDFVTAQKIYFELQQNKLNYPTIKDVVTYLDIHAELYESMKIQILKNSK